MEEHNNDTTPAGLQAAALQRATARRQARKAAVQLIRDRGLGSAVDRLTERLTEGEIESGRYWQIIEDAAELIGWMN